MSETEKNTMEMPVLTPLKMGKNFKAFQITGKKGMEMPSQIGRAHV